MSASRRTRINSTGKRVSGLCIIVMASRGWKKPSCLRGFLQSKLKRRRTHSQTPKQRKQLQAFSVSAENDPGPSPGPSTETQSLVDMDSIESDQDQYMSTEDFQSDR